MQTRSSKGELAADAPQEPEAFAAFRAIKRRLETPHGSISYADAGRGEPIVFLHGVPLNSAHWRDVIKALAPEWRCIAPDLLGLGETERSSTADLGFAGQAAMVIDFLGRLSVDRFHLVGNDSGGAIAQIIACMAPDRVATLTLTNCDVDANVPPPAFARAVAAAKIGMFSVAVAGMRANLSLARSRFGLGPAFENAAHITPELVDAYLTPLLATPARRSDLNAYVAAMSPAPMIAIREKLAALTAPTQLIWATDDIFFSLDDADFLARTIKGMTLLVRAEGARLFFCEERPQWTAARIAEHIRASAP